MELTTSDHGVIAFTYIICMLLLFSYFDIRLRRVPNILTGTGMLFGGGIGFFVGYEENQLFFHVISLAFALLLSMLLFRLKAIGGADAKSLMMVAWTTPGFVFYVYNDPFFEALIGVLLLLLIMFSIGNFLSRRNIKEDTTTPLIPSLLLGYILTQGLGMLLTLSLGT